MAHPLRAATVALLGVLGVLDRGAAWAQRPVPAAHIADSARLDGMGFRAEAGAALATPLARDANGMRVETGVAPMAGIAAAREVSPRITLAGGVRVAASPLRFRDEAGARWASVR